MKKIINSATLQEMIAWHDFVKSKIMQNIKKILVIIIVIFILSFGIVRADTAIHLDIETDTGSIYNKVISVAPCDNTGTGAMEITAYCALDQLEKSGDLPIKSNWIYGGLYIDSINGISNVNDNENNIHKNWMWLVNLNINNPYSDFKCHQDSPSSCSVKEYILNSNDNVLFYYNINPLNISTNNLNPTVGDNITISIKELGLDGWNSVWNPAAGGKLVVGSNTYDLDSEGTYSLAISDTNPIIIKGQKAGFLDTSEITITPQAAISAPDPEPAPVRHSSSGGGSSYILLPVIKPTFDLKKAFEFLISQQKENGSFGEDLYTDWVALALAKANHQDQVLKLIKYLGESKIESPLLTDYERRAMALMALGLNPYNTNSKNYIEKITSQFDGKQFGDINEDNDDIFALIVLQNAGYSQDEKIINDAMSFILSRQKENGSWDDSVDMTGAAIESLSAFSPTPRVEESLAKAKNFLKQNQKDTGGWGNASSTAWVLEGIFTLNEKPEDYIKNGNTPLDYLASVQDTDGGTKNANMQNKIWETAYVASVLSGKNWNQIMQKFEKPKTPPAVEKVTINTVKTPKKIIKKGALTATIINATIPTPIVNETVKAETPKKGWLARFLDKIFSIF